MERPEPTRRSGMLAERGFVGGCDPERARVRQPASSRPTSCSCDEGFSADFHVRPAADAGPPLSWGDSPAAAVEVRLVRAAVALAARRGTAGSRLPDLAIPVVGRSLEAWEETGHRQLVGDPSVGHQPDLVPPQERIVLDEVDSVEGVARDRRSRSAARRRPPRQLREMSRDEGADLERAQADARPPGSGGRTPTTSLRSARSSVLRPGAVVTPRVQRGRRRAAGSAQPRRVEVAEAPAVALVRREEQIRHAVSVAESARSLQAVFRRQRSAPSTASISSAGVAQSQILDSPASLATTIERVGSVKTVNIFARGRVARALRQGADVPVPAEADGEAQREVSGEQQREIRWRALSDRDPGQPGDREQGVRQGIVERQRQRAHARPHREPEPVGRRRSHTNTAFASMWAVIE